MPSFHRITDHRFHHVRYVEQSKQRRSAIKYRSYYKLLIIEKFALLLMISFMHCFLPIAKVIAFDFDSFPTVTCFAKRPSDETLDREVQLEQTCGGSLIAPNIILTSATCAGMIDIVVLGLRSYPFDLSDDQYEKFNVMDFAVHKKFNARTLDHDFMIVKLDRSSKMFLPIGIDDGKERLRNKELFVLGWGSASGDSIKTSTSFDFYPVELIDQSSCSEIYSDFNVSKNMICAKNKRMETSSYCQGDLGGPLVATFREKESNRGQVAIVGIVSWGNDCFAPDMPGVYAKVESIFNWLYEHFNYQRDILPTFPALSPNFENDVDGKAERKKGHPCKDDKPKQKGKGQECDPTMSPSFLPTSILSTIPTHRDISSYPSLFPTSIPSSKHTEIPSMNIPNTQLPSSSMTNFPSKYSKTNSPSSTQTLPPSTNLSLNPSTSPILPPPGKNNSPTFQPSDLPSSKSSTSPSYLPTNLNQSSPSSLSLSQGEEIAITTSAGLALLLLILFVAKRRPKAKDQIASFEGSKDNYREKRLPVLDNYSSGTRSLTSRHAEFMQNVFAPNFWRTSTKSNIQETESITKKESNSWSKWLIPQTLLRRVSEETNSTEVLSSYINNADQILNKLRNIGESEETKDKL